MLMFNLFDFCPCFFLSVGDCWLHHCLWEKDFTINNSQFTIHN